MLASRVFHRKNGLNIILLAKIPKLNYILVMLIIVVVAALLGGGLLIAQLVGDLLGNRRGLEWSRQKNNRPPA